jgi:hypothetical protein
VGEYVKMSEFYVYDLWNGKEVVGTYSSMSELAGNTLIVPYLSEFKQGYNKKIKNIKLPLIVRVVSVNIHRGEVTYRLALDVRRKSKRQIAFLTGKQ